MTTTATIGVCCDDPSHRRWTRYFLARGDDRMWRPVDTDWLKNADGPLHLLSEDTMGPEFLGVERYRYRFWCDKCGDTIVVREEKMRPIFDQLAATSKPDITFRHIRRVTA